MASREVSEPGAINVSSRPARSGAVPWEISFVALAAIWGSSFLFVKLAVVSLTPIQISLARMLMGSAILFAIMLLRHEQLPRGVRMWAHLFVAGFLLNVVPFTLLAYGEARTTAVLAGIWNATTPFFTVILIMLLHREERPSVERTMGLVLGFIGVAVVLGFWNGLGGSQLIGNLFCLGNAAGFGAGLLYMRKYLSAPTDSPVGVVTGQIFCGTLELAVLLPFLGGIPSTISLTAGLSLLSLGVLGTGLAYYLNYFLIRDAGATVASVVSYVIPLFSTVSGVVFLSEPLTWNEPVGGAIIIGGVMLSEMGFGTVRTLLYRRSISTDTGP